MTDTPAIRMLTHEDDDKIPEGFAMLYMDNNGWAGTNNGYPHHGQPALYPREQAKAIQDAWWYYFILGIKARKGFDERQERVSTGQNQ